MEQNRNNITANNGDLGDAEVSACVPESENTENETMTASKIENIDKSEKLDVSGAARPSFAETNELRANEDRASEVRGELPCEDDTIELAPEQSRTHKLITYLAIAVIALLLGVYIGTFLNGKTWPLFGAVPSTYESDEQAPAVEVAYRLYEVARSMDANGIYNIDLDQATQQAIEALLKSTGDKYAAYYTEDRFETYLQYSSGSYCGIGIVMTNAGNYTMIANVYDGSPAAEAGVQVGDVIVSIDGVQQQWTPDAASKAIEREEGDTVEIVWLRPSESSLNQILQAINNDNNAVVSGTSTSEQIDQNGEAVAVTLEGEEFSAQLTYSEITIPNVTYSMIDDTGYIALESFNLEASDAVEEAVTELEKQGAKSLVLDLRDNGGGYVSQAISIVSLFQGEGAVLQSQSKSGTKTENVTGNKITDLPLVLLVNGDSASASEIVACALQDHGRATVVGTVTYRKGTMQDLVPLSFGGAIKYTISEYLSPNGTQINQVGVVPDIEVQQPDTAVLGDLDTDVQLQRALQEAAALQ